MSSDDGHDRVIERLHAQGWILAAECPGMYKRYTRAPGDDVSRSVIVPVNPDAADYEDLLSAARHAAGMSSDDGRTVAVPLTQEQAEGRATILQEMWHDLRCPVRSASGPGCQCAAMRNIDAVLSASPEVLAAAMGGRLELLNDAYVVASPGAGGRIPCIVLPPREVSRGE